MLEHKKTGAQRHQDVSPQSSVAFLNKEKPTLRCTVKTLRNKHTLPTKTILTVNGSTNLDDRTLIKVPADVASQLREEHIFAETV